MNRFIALFVFCVSCSLSQADTPNLLVITVDDMSCDSAGVFDGVISDLTPHMDQLALKGCVLKWRMFRLATATRHAMSCSRAGTRTAQALKASIE